MAFYVGWKDGGWNFQPTNSKQAAALLNEVCHFLSFAPLLSGLSPHKKVRVTTHKDRVSLIHIENVCPAKSVCSENTNKYGRICKSGSKPFSTNCSKSTDPPPYEWPVCNSQRNPKGTPELRVGAWSWNRGSFVGRCGHFSDSLGWCRRTAFWFSTYQRLQICGKRKSREVHEFDAASICLFCLLLSMPMVTHGCYFNSESVSQPRGQL